MTKVKEVLNHPLVSLTGIWLAIAVPVICGADLVFQHLQLQRMREAAAAAIAAMQ